MTVFLAATVCCAAGVAVYALAGAVSEKVALQRSLRRLDDYGDSSGDDGRPDVAGPLLGRTVSPLAARAAAMGNALTPAGYVESARRKLTLAGRPGAAALDRFLATRLIALALVVPWGLVVALLPLPGALPLTFFAFGAFAVVVGPNAVLNRAVQSRQQEIRAGLPDVLDLLSVSVEAGFGLDQAFERVSTDVTGPLSEELRRMQGDIRAGASRATAMRALTERTDVAELRSFISAILQADAFGVSIAPVLRAQSEDMRVRWRQLVQERAQKAPVKMLVPMVFCIFPALFVVVIGPAFINIRAGL